MSYFLSSIIRGSPNDDQELVKRGLTSLFLAPDQDFVDGLPISLIQKRAQFSVGDVFKTLLGGDHKKRSSAYWQMF